MAKVKLQAGAEVDILSAKEQAEITARKSAADARRSPLVLRDSGEVVTDASGDFDGELYRVPQGSRVLVHRLSLWDPTVTPAAPNSTGWLAVYRNGAEGAPIEFAPEPGSTNVLPVLFTATSDGPVLRGGELLWLHVVGTTPSIRIVYGLELDLWNDQLPPAVTVDELG